MSINDISHEDLFGHIEDMQNAISETLKFFKGMEYFEKKYGIINLSNSDRIEILENDDLLSMYCDELSEKSKSLFSIDCINEFLNNNKL